MLVGEYLYMDENKLNNIITRAIKGDKRAFVKLCEDRAQQILYLCVKLMGNYHDGEDAAQEILLIMQRDIVKLQNPDAFKTWLYRLIVRNCMKMKKKLQVHDSLPIEDYAETIGESRDEFLPQSFVENQSSKEQLQLAIGKLPEDCRHCLMLYYYEDLKYAEIAQRMNITTNDVGNLLVKAKKLLSRDLDSQRSASKHQ